MGMIDKDKREMLLHEFEKFVREYNPGCTDYNQDMLEAVLDHLKAQEPRVMTLEEYKAWMDIPFCERDPILLEMKSRRGTETWWTNTAECSIENYGKTERCWTSRPTDEQREAEPWE